MRMQKTFFLIFVFFIWTIHFPALQAGEANIANDSCFASPSVVKLEQKIKEIFHERGYSDSVLQSFFFSGSLILNEPELVPKSMEGLAQKYSCVAVCNISVQYVGSGEVMFEVDKSFFDIGRSESSACKFTIGKVMHYFLDEINKNMNDESGITDLEYRINNQKDIFDKHIEQLYGFVLGMVEETEKGLRNNHLEH